VRVGGRVIAWTVGGGVGMMTRVDALPRAPSIVSGLIESPLRTADALCHDREASLIRILEWTITPSDSQRDCRPGGAPFRIAGVAIAIVAAIAACRLSQSPPRGSYLGPSRSVPAMTSLAEPSRAVGVPDTVIRIPAAETVLAIRSGSGSAPLPVAFVVAPEYAVYARCVGGTSPVEIRSGSDVVEVPCYEQQVRQLVVSATRASTVTLTADPSTRWTLAVSRPEMAVG
jgi:hypothetical protein